MSRSNREARPNQVPDGGGPVNAEKTGMGVGQNIKAKDTKGGISGKEMASERNAARKKERPAGTSAPGEAGGSEGDSGWGKIGDAGESIVKTYKSNQSSKSSGSSGSGSKTSRGA